MALQTPPCICASQAYASYSRSFLCMLNLMVDIYGPKVKGYLPLFRQQSGQSFWMISVSHHEDLLTHFCVINKFRKGGFYFYFQAGNCLGVYPLSKTCSHTIKIIRTFLPWAWRFYFFICKSCMTIIKSPGLSTDSWQSTSNRKSLRSLPTE